MELKSIIAIGLVVFIVAGWYSCMCVTGKRDSNFPAGG